MYSRFYLSWFLVLLLAVSPVLRGEAIDLASDSLTTETYNPAKLVETANKLIDLGKDKADASLLKYAETNYAYSSYVAWLCLLVYDPKPDAGLPIPLFGAPDFPYTFPYTHGLINSVDWPRFPLTLNRGVPFLLVSGYTVGGVPESGTAYIQRCQSNGTFHAVEYPIVTHSDARIGLDDLLSSAKWDALSWPHFVGRTQKIKFLRSQVERVRIDKSELNFR